MDRIWEAANRLAATLTHHRWYHRTSFTDAKDQEGRWLCYLTVWGEGPRPAAVPQSFEGFLVSYNRVSKKHPCPFGSVKTRYRT